MSIKKIIGYILALTGMAFLVGSVYQYAAHSRAESFSAAAGMILCLIGAILIWRSGESR